MISNGRRASRERTSRVPEWVKNRVKSTSLSEYLDQIIDDEPVGLDKNVEQIEHPIATADLLFYQAKALRLGLRFQFRERPQTAIILLIWTEDSQMAQFRQNTVEVGKGGSHSLSQRPHERLSIQRFS